MHKIYAHTLKALVTKAPRVYVWMDFGRTHEGNTPVGGWVWGTKKDILEILKSVPDSTFCGYRECPTTQNLYIRWADNT